ncbi:MAG TPA: hypothetical protein VK504_02200 [Vicinamibacterales bacterium]|jgi:hypothetical protein|nr:hypothetical protein [Vicinamibacterales bacterium]
MDTQTIRHTSTGDKSPLHLETATRALRHSVWVSLYLAQDLSLEGVEGRLTATLREVDRVLAELELV